MKNYIKLLVVIFPIFFACSTNTDVIQQDIETKLYANFSQCLNEIGVIKVETDSVPMTIIEWQYDNNILSIQHKNAGFNCCFDSILISVNNNSGIIEISEKEVGKNRCACNCPRDIDFKIKSLSQGIYTFNIKEALKIDEFTPISFEAELKNGNKGLIRFERPFYPWGLGNY
jgi:hypothetical protein